MHRRKLERKEKRFVQISFNHFLELKKEAIYQIYVNRIKNEREKRIAILRKERISALFPGKTTFPKENKIEKPHMDAQWIKDNGWSGKQ
jgi:hypothetical protein